MEQSFYRSPNIRPEQFGALLKKDNRRSSVHFLLMYGIFITAGVVLVLSWNQTWWIALPALFVFATSVSALFACGHESIHQTAFRSRRLNYWTAFLSGAGYGYAPTMFRAFHFAHHRYTHQPGLDPEISVGRWPVPSVIQQLPSYLAWLSGIPFMLFRFLMLVCGALGMPAFIRRLLFPFVEPEQRLAIFLESWVILAIHGSIVYVALFVNPAFWGLLWGQVLGSALLASYTAAEHNGLPHEGSILEKTRSLRSSKGVRWWMWNMPYHAEHHAYPSVPYHALPELHHLLQEELIHKDSSHAEFHQQVLRDVTIGKLKAS
jgi:fatty acid desaturase